MESMGPILFVAVANFQSVMQLESRVDMQPSVVFTVPIKTTKAARVTRFTLPQCSLPHPAPPPKPGPGPQSTP